MSSGGSSIFGILMVIGILLFSIIEFWWIILIVVVVLFFSFLYSNSSKSAAKTYKNDLNVSSMHRDVNEGQKGFVRNESAIPVENSDLETIVNRRVGLAYNKSEVINGTKKVDKLILKTPNADDICNDSIQIQIKNEYEVCHDVSCNVTEKTTSDISISPGSQNGIVPIVAWPNIYVFSKDDLRNATLEQKVFYEYFKSQFLASHYIDLVGNINYAFILMFDLVDMFDSKEDRPMLENFFHILAVQYPKTADYTQKALLKFDEKILAQETIKNLDNIAKSSQNKARWISFNEEVIVSELRLKRGGFYLGGFLSVPKCNVSYRYDRSYKEDATLKYLCPVINPDLEVEDVDDLMMPFNSYSTLSKGMRYKYLKFLSGDISFLDVDNSLLYLYLIGLEYRMFVDKETKSNDKKDILKYLVKIYNERSHCDTKYYENGYISKLIDRGALLLCIKDPTELLGELDIRHLYYYSNFLLNEFCLGEKQLSAEQIFEFAEKYYHITKRYPSGDKNKEAIKNSFIQKLVDSQASLSYHSSYFENPDYDTMESLGNDFYNEFFKPDISEVYYMIHHSSSNISHNILFSIQNAANAVDCDSAKHWELLNNNNGVHTAYADMNFASYIDPSNEQTLKNLASKINTFFDEDGYALVKVKDFVEWIQYPPRKEKGIFRNYALVIVEALRKMGYGIAPNPLVENDRLMLDGYCCLFKLEGDTYLSIDAVKGKTISKMACQISLSNKITMNDFHLLHEGLQIFGYESNTAKYEVAYAKQYSLSKQHFNNNIIRDIFTNDEAILVYKLLLRFTFNNGNVNSERVKTLKSYCIALGQNPEKIHSAIHEIITDCEFATVEKTTGAVMYSIPNPNDNIRTFSIDSNKLSIIQRQTTEAQKMLTDIFTGEQPQNSTTPVRQKYSGVPERQQQKVLMKLLVRLFEKEVWDLTEVDELCNSNEQMTGFVLEKINDYSFEKVGDAVLSQNEDKIYVMLDYKEKLL